MNARNTVTHEQATELLPWLVNDTLGSDEKEGVLEHARACVICRREMDELNELRESITQTAAPIPAPDMRNINVRIDDLIDRQNWSGRLAERVRDSIASPWRLAFIAQSVLLVVFAAFLLWPDAENGEFTTLTETSDLGDGAYIRVVFSPEFEAAEISSVLDRFELEVVGGPSTRGVYTLGLDDSMTPQDRDNFVLLLQGDPRVLFAQPVIQRADQ